MELTVEQIQTLKKEIEGIWTHLNNLEKQLAEKKEPPNDSFSQSANETIEMLERMKQKIETQELENEQMASDDLDREINQALIHANVKKALDEIKQQLGI